MEFVATAAVPRNGQVDLPAVKAAILGSLDLESEFARLGVRFSGPPGGNGRGVRECHAMDRDDSNPSAFVNVRSGVYHDSGGQGATLSFWDFALRYGSFGRFLDVLKHYAEAADVDLGHPAVSKGGRIREATYLYREADGRVRYAVFRHRLPNGKKTFSQHPPDGRGGWKYGEGCMDGVAPLPYRLPELLADPEEAVWIVEGEQDADRLAGLGLAATTSHSGSGGTDVTWPHFLDHFRGRDCYILADHDVAGVRHARKVAGYLHGVARTVKVVDLPGLGPLRAEHGLDVSDWLDLGHDLDELGRLAHAAAPWDPEASREEPAPADRPCRLATAADLIRAGETTTWLWENWLPRGVLVLVAAEANTGKTRFCLDLSKIVNLGLDWPDGSPNPLPAGSRTLWVAADSQHKELADGALNYGFDPWSVVLNTEPDDIYGGTELATAQQLATLEFNIRDVKPALVFIDTITNTSDHKSQDTSDAKKQYKPLQEIAQRTGTTIVCVTHMNARGKVVGRRANEKTRVTIALVQPDPDDRRLRLEVTHTRHTEKPPALGVTMSTSGNTYDTHPPTIPEPEESAPKKAPRGAKVQEAIVWLRGQLAGGPVRSGEIRDAAAEAGIIPDSSSAMTLYTALRRLGGEECTLPGYRGKWFRVSSNGDIPSEDEDPFA